MPKGVTGKILRREAKEIAIKRYEMKKQNVQNQPKWNTFTVVNLFELSWSNDEIRRKIENYSKITIVTNLIKINQMIFQNMYESLFKPGFHMQLKAKRQTGCIF